MRLNASNTVTLTPPQLVAWGNVLTALSWKASAFMSLLYDLLNPERSIMVAVFLSTEGIPSWFLAGTNGKRLFICAERFFKLTLEEQIFLLSHEVGHPMLGHIIAAAYYRKLGYIDVGFKHLPWNDMLANMAQDLVINDMLIESRIGKFITSGLHDPTIGTYRDSWIDVYERLLDERGNGPGKGDPCEDGEDSDKPGKPGNSGGSSGKPGKPPKNAKGKPDKSDKGDKGDKDKPEDPEDQQAQRNGQKGFDSHMPFGKGEPKPGDQPGGGTGEPDTNEGEPLEYDDSWKDVTKEDLDREMKKAQQATAAAMELARSRGNLPAALKQFCEKLLEPSVDWTEHVKSMFARKIGSGGYDFRRPNRRFLVRDIIIPGRSGKGAGLVIIGGDSSGSIYAVPALTARWMAECGGMVEDVNPRECHVVWCDAEIQRLDVLTDMQDVHKMVHKGSEGGGGTDFRPVFAYAESLGVDIDCMVYLTDGDGMFPDHPPKFPVIWGDISGDKKKYPFGDVVHIPVPNKALR